MAVLEVQLFQMREAQGKEASIDEPLRQPRQVLQDKNGERDRHRRRQGDNSSA